MPNALNILHEPRGDLQRIINDLRKPDRSSHPNFTLCIGMCRSGSTALTAAYANSGFTSYYQPVKADLRQLSMNLPPENIQKLLQSESGNLFSKETIGPFCDFEINFDIISIYQSLGYDLDHAHIIFTMRDLRKTLSSWITHWESEIPREKIMQNFINSGFSFISSIEMAKAKGLRYTLFPQEVALGWLESDFHIWELIFRRSQASSTFSAKWLRNWPRHFFDFPNLTRPEEPEIFTRIDVHNTIGYYGLVEGNPNRIPRKSLDIGEENTLIESGLDRAWKALSSNNIQRR